MTQAEKDRLLEAGLKALESGDEERFNQLLEQYPADPDYIMGIKNILGANIVLSAGVNLSEVEAKYGANWYR